MTTVAESLRALVGNLIDYAGLFPPAALTLPAVAERYRGYLSSPDAWMLNRLVLPAARLAELPLPSGARITLLVEDDPGPLPAEVESLETRAPRRFPLPTYCEVPLDEVPPGAFAKLRTGGLTPEAIPSAADLANLLLRAAEMRLPFKATAGLHFPMRSLRPLTYAVDSPRAVMHGFLNVFAAAAFAWHGARRDVVAGVIEETDPAAFAFDDRAMHWHGQSLTTAEIWTARRDFAHSFGSCSFDEPVAGLRHLELIP